MLFDELLKSDLLKLPFNQERDLSFRDYVKKILDEYLNLLNDLDSSSISISGIKATKETIIKRQNEFVNGLMETVRFYYDGYPEASFNSLKNTIESRIRPYRGFFKIDSYDKETNFYRIRILNDNNHLNPESFFHIPFELRGKVSSQRFSIPGFPSLYLGSSVYICWEELNRPNINEFHSVRLKSLSSIKYFDLAPPYFDDDLYQSKYYKYLMSWPLIFLCSIRVRNKQDIFKPEYIIPQLLLQWIRENKEIDGIRYWSTHVDQNPTVFKGEFYNLVLPVKENKDVGLCKSLTRKFQTTEIVSWQLYEFALGGDISLDFNDNVDDIDSKMEYLELIRGMKYPYSHSVFGKIEKYLTSLKTNNIENASHTV
jgi:hypothetical protein